MRCIGPDFFISLENLSAVVCPHVSVNIKGGLFGRVLDWIRSATPRCKLSLTFAKAG